MGTLQSMIKGIAAFLRGGELSQYREEVNTENRMAIRMFVSAGIPISIVNYICQLIVAENETPVLNSTWLMVYIAVLFFVERFFLPKNCRHATGLFYLLEAPVMLMAVLLGTVWDPTHQATTILLFLMALPIFVLDRPVRSMGILGVWSVLFLILCRAVKEERLIRVDSIHVLEYYLAAGAMTNVMYRVRLESLRRLIKTRYQLDHDRETDCLSRYALTSRTERYLGKPVVLLLANLDQLALYNDFYGHDAGDAMTLYFTRSLMECFGKESCFRYSGEEVLCAVTGRTAEECLMTVARCREKLHAFEYEGKKISLNSSFGYVTGAPSTAQEFREMIRLADIYAHKVKKSGMDQTFGGPFDAASLREGIVESNRSSHARAYEINQLTGLPGMSYFVARSDELLASVADIDRSPLIGCVKVMRLRDYNNEFGYSQGDVLIADVARLLQKHYKSRHVCYITSGQFGVLCYREEAEAAVKRVNEDLKNYRAGFDLRCKAGFAPYTGCETAISLLDKARQAQKSVLDQKYRDVCFYDTRLDAELRFQQYVLNHVDDALEKGYLKVYYQPIVRTLTGEVCNEEALSRWDDPRYGFLPPYRFIPTLEENGLMYKVNLAVVRQALRDFRQRQEAGVPIVPVSVNLSRRDFEQCDMVREITQMVDASGFPRSFIKIEITESAFIANQDLMMREVSRFRENGFEVWMDDFGSEYSTLNLLQDMDFDLIKIDMQFMRNFTAEGKNFIIVSDIIDMAKRMGVTTLIEGIETREQNELMQKLGCEKIQGFLFNKPNPPEYIIHRAKTGTGLTFENPEAAPYYEAIGRIDLSAPMSRGAADGRLYVNNENPVGVLERREGRFICLRGTDRFISLLEKWGVLEARREGEKYRVLRDPAPQTLVKAAESCKRTGEWVNYTPSSSQDHAFSVYMRRVCEYEKQGSLALLAVLLHGRASDGGDVHGSLS